jgi:hypothetical protein
MNWERARLIAKDLFPRRRPVRMGLVERRGDLLVLSVEGSEDVLVLYGEGLQGVLEGAAAARDCVVVRESELPGFFGHVGQKLPA